jgi:hypothetical protein
MSIVAHMQRALRRASGDEGFTLIAVIGIMLVTSLLLASALTASSDDIQLSHDDVLQKQAYFTSLSGVQEFEYELENNPDYWQSCPSPSATEEDVRYEVTILGANGRSACSAANPFESVIESGNAAANTFRIVSVGCAGKPKLSNCTSEAGTNVKTETIVATFKVSGFLNYVYFTKYEDEDPQVSGQSKAECERYYKEGASIRSSSCVNIEFAGEDSVNGPMHTDDTAQVECSTNLSFGREKHQPPDVVEMYGGTNPEKCGAGSEPKYFTAEGTHTKGTELNPPESDTSLKLYVEPKNEIYGSTHLILKGSEVKVKHWIENTTTHKLEEAEESIEPKNGLIYIADKSAWGCTFEFSEGTPFEVDSASELTEEKGCGNVYVEGNYSKALTIAAEDELIINGNITQTGVSAGSTPTGTDTLGLIATYFVRVYHPCTQSGGEQTGYLSEPWIYAAILSTAHSFIVDNYECGAISKTGTLHVYGAIAQKFRGPVGIVGTHGYHKDYKYDERLATDEPPYFLAPLKAGWKIVRETVVKEG